MDTLGIIKKEGYRREDLNEQNQTIMRWLDVLTEHVETLKGNLGFIDEEMEEEGSAFGALKKEACLATLEAVMEWIEIGKAEIQIELAENEEGE